MEKEKVLLKELLEKLHYKDLNKEVKIKLNNDLYIIKGISESTKNGLTIDIVKED